MVKEMQQLEDAPSAASASKPLAAAYVRQSKADPKGKPTSVSNQLKAIRAAAKEFFLPTAAVFNESVKSSSGQHALQRLIALVKFVERLGRR